MSPESWQNVCPRCGWANSGAEKRCMKCGQALRTSPGLLVAGQSSASAISPASQPKVRKVVQPGGFFPRLIAIIIDVLILGVVAVPIAYLVLSQAKSTTVTQPNAFVNQVRGLNSALSGLTADQVTQLLQLQVVLLLVQIFYYVGTWSILGGSPGQLVMSLRVVDASAKTIGFGRAFWRYLMKGGAPPVVGLLIILWPISALMVAAGKDKRAFHDVLAGTFVIQFLDPKLEDLEEALGTPTSVAQPAAAPAAPPPVVASPLPQEVYAGAALAAAAVTAPPAEPPAPPAPPPVAQPAIPSQLPPPMSPAPAATDQSAFERYAPPSDPAPTPATAPAPPDPASAAPSAPPAAPSPPAAPPQPTLPVFPTSDPGGYQPMAPAPSARPSESAPGAPGAADAPYEMPFAPAPRPPTSPPPAPDTEP